MHVISRFPELIHMLRGISIAAVLYVNLSKSLKLAER